MDIGRTRMQLSLLSAQFWSSCHGVLDAWWPRIMIMMLRPWQPSGTPPFVVINPLKRQVLFSIALKLLRVIQTATVTAADTAGPGAARSGSVPSSTRRCVRWQVRQGPGSSAFPFYLLIAGLSCHQGPRAGPPGVLYYITQNVQPCNGELQTRISLPALVHEYF